MHKISHLHCIGLKKENVAYVLYACIKSRSLASVSQGITAFLWRSGQGKREDNGNRFVRFDWTCAQRLRRQKVIELSSCYLIYSFYFHVKDKGKRKTHSYSVVGKGQSKVVVSLLCTPVVVSLQREVLCSFHWLSTQPKPACGSSRVQLLLGNNKSCGLGLWGSILTMQQVDWILVWFVTQAAWGKMVRFPTSCS